MARTRKVRAFGGVSATMFIGLAALAGGALVISHQKANAPAPSQPADTGATGAPTPSSPVSEAGGITEGVMTFPGRPHETVTTENDGLGPQEPDVSAPGSAGGTIGSLGLGPEVATETPPSGASVPNAVFVGTNTTPSTYGTAVYGTGAKGSKILDGMALSKWGHITGAVY